jgi:hypothetical protein
MKEAQEGMSIDLYDSIVSEGRKEEMERKEKAEKEGKGAGNGERFSDSLRSCEEEIMGSSPCRCCDDEGCQIDLLAPRDEWLRGSAAAHRAPSRRHRCF